MEHVKIYNTLLNRKTQMLKNETYTVGEGWPGVLTSIILVIVCVWSNLFVYSTHPYVTKNVLTNETN